MIVLHVLGSPLDSFAHKLNLLYFSKFEEFEPYTFRYAVVWPSSREGDSTKNWTFPEKREDLVNEALEKVRLSDAIAQIQSLVPDVICPHFFCYPGTTKYRAVLELLEIPIIGNLSRRYEICMDKELTKAVLSQAGVSVPAGMIVRKADQPFDPTSLSYPMIVKPTLEENSVGLTVVHHAEELQNGLNKAFGHGDTALVEKFIAGREIRCGVFEDSKGQLTHVSPIEYLMSEMDIRTFDDKYTTDDQGLPSAKSKTVKHKFFDRAAEPELSSRLNQVCEHAYRELRLQDYSIFDIRVDAAGQPHILEVNLFCAFSPDSFLCLMAKPDRWTNEQIFNVMVQNALCRYELTKKHEILTI